MEHEQSRKIGDSYAALGFALMRDPSQGYYIRVADAGERRVLRLRTIEQAALLLEWFAPRATRAPLTIEEWHSYPIPIWNQVHPLDR